MHGIQTNTTFVHSGRLMKSLKLANYLTLSEIKRPTSMASKAFLKADTDEYEVTLAGRSE